MTIWLHSTLVSNCILVLLRESRFSNDISLRVFDMIAAVTLDDKHRRENPFLT